MTPAEREFLTRPADSNVTGPRYCLVGDTFEFDGYPWVVDRFDHGYCIEVRPQVCHAGYGVWDGLEITVDDTTEPTHHLDMLGRLQRSFTKELRCITDMNAQDLYAHWQELPA